MKARSCKPRKNCCRLEMPTGAPSQEMLRNFALDCLAPLLAHECLRAWQAEPGKPEASANVSTSALSYREECGP